MPLKVSDGIAAWIKDFKKSDAPQFKGKSEKERRDQAIAAYLSAKRGNKKLGEEFMFRVEVEGLPQMFMKGNSPGEVKTHLRKLVKQPSMVKSVDRMTKHDIKKRRRKQAELGEGMNRRDRLRAKLAAVGKDMEKTNKELKKTIGVKDKPQQRLGSDGKPYKSKYFKDEVDPARDEGKPGAVKHAKKMTPGQQNEKITIGKIRKMAYKTGKTLGDVQAVKKKKIGKRIARRAAGKLVGRALGALFK